jgi:uncharacterized damage-inducible protein DinB
MHIPEIQLLFDYYYWATARILSVAEQISNEQFTQVHVYCQRSLRATLVHALSSERIWRARWQGDKPLANLDEHTFPTLVSLRTYWKEQEQEMQTFLASMQEEDLTHLIKGVTAGGTAYVDLVWHSMMQVLFHGAQHRSEAAEIVTAYGFSPGELDFFVFLRQKDRDQIASKTVQ